MKSEIEFLSFVYNRYRLSEVSEDNILKGLPESFRNNKKFARKNLDKLKTLGLVEKKPRRKGIFSYRITKKGMTQILAYMKA